MIKTLMKSTLLATGFTIVASVASSQTTVELRKELDLISDRISTAEAVVFSGESEAVRSIARLRLEIWELAYALVQNRIYVVEGTDSRRVVVPEVEADADRERSVRRELNLVRERVRNANEDLEDLEDLERPMARIRLESELLTESQLLLAYYQAKYGIRLPGISDIGTGLDGALESTADTGAQDSSRLSGATRPLTADISDSLLFQREMAKGATVSEWWTIASEPGSSEMSALNHSAYRRSDSGRDLGALLQIECSQDEFSVSYLLPGRTLKGSAGGAAEPALEVAYRLGSGERRFQIWAESPGGQGAVLYGAEARELFFDLAGTDEFLIDLWEADNNLHSSQFELAGYLDVAEAAIQVCTSQPDEEPLRLIRQDYRLIQTLLNIAGFDAGPADGIWGPRSESAMRQYQHSAGLAQTGHPNRDTLELLGLAD